MDHLIKKIADANTEGVDEFKLRDSVISGTSTCSDYDFKVDLEDLKAQASEIDLRREKEIEYLMLMYKDKIISLLWENGLTKPSEEDKVDLRNILLRIEYLNPEPTFDPLIQSYKMMINFNISG